MRIDRCKGCGNLIDIASDHASECPTRKPLSPTVAHTLIYITSEDDKPMTVKLRFHGDGTVTWQRLWNG